MWFVQDLPFWVRIIEKHIIVKNSNNEIHLDTAICVLSSLKNVTHRGGRF